MLQISQKTFLIGGFLAFLVAGAILFTLHNHALDPETTGNWWALRFTYPATPQDLTFEIQNHSPHTTGRYTITVDERIVLEESFVVSGVLTRLSPAVATEPTNRVRITVQLGNEEKTLTR